MIGGIVATSDPRDVEMASTSEPGSAVGADQKLALRGQVTKRSPRRSRSGLISARESNLICVSENLHYSLAYGSNRALHFLGTAAASPARAALLDSTRRTRRGFAFYAGHGCRAHLCRNLGWTGPHTCRAGYRENETELSNDDAGASACDPALPQV